MEEDVGLAGLGPLQRKHPDILAGLRVLLHIEKVAAIGRE
jgi:hypothetical protein